MKNVFKWANLSFFLYLPFVATFGCAEEGDADSTDGLSEIHVEVRSREIDSERRERLKRLKAEEQEEEAHCLSNHPYYLHRASTRMDLPILTLAPAYPLPPTTLYTTHYSCPSGCHFLQSISDTNRSIAIEDGSHWEISSSDTHHLNSWQRDHQLMITPNRSWFSTYDYYITNKHTGNYVHANLKIGPVAFGPYSHWLVEIDELAGHLFLENHTIWCVNPKETHQLRNWTLNDHIIVGVNDSWFSQYDRILINVNLDEYVCVKQY